MKGITDNDGEWEVRGRVRLLVKPSLAFEERRRLDSIQAEIAQAERDVVQAERDRCIAYLKKQANLDTVNLAKQKYTEAKLEMSFEDIIQMVRANREAVKKQLLGV